MSPQQSDASAQAKTSLPDACDVAIVGAGPAGMAAATLITELGLDAVLLDEQHEPGGQVYRGLATATPVRRAALGPEYEHGMNLLAVLDRSRVRQVPGASVCGVASVDNGFELCVVLGREAWLVHARCVILAVGALNWHLPIEGWKLPGVTSTGDVLTHLPMSASSPERRTVPDIQLADMLGCDMAWDDTAACWRPRVDAWGASSVPGVFIAGDGAGIVGANAAAQHGALSALDAATSLGRIDTPKRNTAAVRFRQALAQALRGRRFLDTVYRPPERFREPQGDTIVCHCENVAAREVIAAVHEGCTGPNQMKAFTRCGMGPCQGRDCSLAVTELIARERGVHPSTVGRFRARFPAKALTLGQLASLPSSMADRNAVTHLPEDD